MRHHLTPAGIFKSDKYDWCPEGFFALKLTDPIAQRAALKYAAMTPDKELAADLREAVANIRKRKGEDSMKGVFLGGTRDSAWRDELIPLLKAAGIKYFNPVVPNWTPDDRAKEDARKAMPDIICLFVITSQMTGVFSIAEAVDMSNKAPDRTVFAFVRDGFTPGQIKSLEAVERLVKGNGAMVAHGDMKEIALGLKNIRENRKETAA